MGEGFDGVGRYDATFANDILRADLEGVEEKAGFFHIDVAGAEGIDDLSEGDLDGAAVFKDGEVEIVLLCDGRLVSKGPVRTFVPLPPTLSLAISALFSLG